MPARVHETPTSYPASSQALPRDSSSTIAMAEGEAQKTPVVAEAHLVDTFRKTASSRARGER